MMMTMMMIMAPGHASGQCGASGPSAQSVVDAVSSYDIVQLSL